MSVCESWKKLLQFQRLSGPHRRTENTCAASEALCPAIHLRPVIPPRNASSRPPARSRSFYITQRTPHTNHGRPNHFTAADACAAGYPEARHSLLSVFPLLLSLALPLEYSSLEALSTDGFVVYKQHTEATERLGALAARAGNSVSFGTCNYGQHEWAEREYNITQFVIPISPAGSATLSC